MRAFARDRLARRFGGVLVALLAGVVFTPSVARATCGDYLVRGAHRPGAAMRGAVGAMPAAAHRTAPTDHGQNTSCSGPNCSRGRPSDVPPPAPPAPARGDRDLYMTAWPAPGGGEAVVPLFDDGARNPRRRGRVIYHPPRAHLSRTSA